MQQVTTGLPDGLTDRMMSMILKKIKYMHHKIEVPKGASIEDAIKIVNKLFPETKKTEWIFKDNTLEFKITSNTKGSYKNFAELAPILMNQVKNPNTMVYKYHKNPSSEIPEPEPTIPEESGGYFIDGDASMGAGEDSFVPIPRIVGGDITPEAIEDAKRQTQTTIGDSLGVGTESHLKSFMWKQDTYNNYGSRQWTFPEKIYDALAQLEDMLRSNQVHQNVVMILGTNRGVEAEEISRAVDMIGPSRNLILVDTASEVPHAPSVAEAYLLASEQYPNVFYANWSQYANPDWYGGDNIHMSSEGYKKHAEFITQAIYEVMNTDWTAGMSGSLAQPTASKYDKSKANNITTISSRGWVLSEINNFRLDAADPPFLTGDYINRWLKHNRPNAALNGHGHTVKLMSDYFGVSVGLALGVWGKETQWGLTSCGGRYNLGCRVWSASSGFPKKWTRDRDWIDPPTIEVAIADWFQYVRFFYIEKRNVKRYEDFLNIYSPGYENDQSSFKDIAWGVIKSLGYDVTDRVQKNNYGKENDPTNQTSFLGQVQSLAKENENAGRGGSTLSGGNQIRNGIFKTFPTVPSKSQINYGYAYPGYESHKGIDIIYTDNSSNIFAVDDGVVDAIITNCHVGNRECGGGWGNYVKIRHNNGYYTLYAHLTSTNVRRGQAVKAGQQIGVMGNTGRSDGKHLHFEVWKGNSTSSRIDPESVIHFTGYKRLFPKPR